MRVRVLERNAHREQIESRGGPNALDGVGRKDALCGRQVWPRVCECPELVALLPSLAAEHSADGAVEEVVKVLWRLVVVVVALFSLDRGGAAALACLSAREEVGLQRGVEGEEGLVVEDEGASRDGAGREGAEVTEGGRTNLEGAVLWRDCAREGSVGVHLLGGYLGQVEGRNSEAGGALARPKLVRLAHSLCCALLRSQDTWTPLEELLLLA